MRFLSMPLLPLLSSTLIVWAQDTNTTFFVVTALVSKNNNSAFECWQLTEPFKRSSIPGVSGTEVATIGNITNLAYDIIPPRFDGGIHNAPVPQIVHFLSGLAHITVPHDDTVEAFIVGGVGGLVFALDTVGTGHITRYPSDGVTVSITAPFENGNIPKHVVLNHGACAGKQTFT